MAEYDERKRLFGLSGLIREVQLALPDWLTLTVSSIEGTEDGECFHIKLNGIFIPLDYYDPSKKINALIDHLHSYVRYESGAAIFDAAKPFTVKDHFKLDAYVLHEILSNLANNPVVIFISKQEWYVDILDSGLFCPLNHVSAAELLDYITAVVSG